MAEQDQQPGNCESQDTVPEYRYELISSAGIGGWGQVWKARDLQLRRLVAFKRIHPGIAHDPDFQMRFQREAQALAAIEHPGIVRVYDLGVDSVGLYIVMQWVDGQNLCEHLQSDGKLTLKRAVSIICSAANALASAHDHGIVHRDIKPSNIMIANDGSVYVADFGIARINRESQPTEPRTVSGQFLGTYEFASPEQLVDASKVDASSDQWSLAATLYFLLTACSVRGMRESLIPTVIRKPMLRALEPLPRDRYANIREFAESLQDDLNTLKEKCDHCGLDLVASDRYCKWCGNPSQATRSEF